MTMSPAATAVIAEHARETFAPSPEIAHAYCATAHGIHCLTRGLRDWAGSGTDARYIGYGISLSSLEYCRAWTEGHRGDAIARRIQELREEPDPQILAQAMKSARLGYLSEMLTDLVGYADAVEMPLLRFLKPFVHFKPSQDSALAVVVLCGLLVAHGCVAGGKICIGANVVDGTLVELQQLGTLGMLLGMAEAVYRRLSAVEKQDFEAFYRAVLAALDEQMIAAIAELLRSPGGGASVARMSASISKRIPN